MNATWIYVEDHNELTIDDPEKFKGIEWVICKDRKFLKHVHLPDAATFVPGNICPKMGCDKKPPKEILAIADILSA